MKRKFPFEEETSRKMVRTSESLYESERGIIQTHLATEYPIDNVMDSTSNELGNATSDNCFGTTNSNAKQLDFKIDEGIKLISHLYQV